MSGFLHSWLHKGSTHISLETKASDKTVSQYFSFRVGIFDWCGTSGGVKMMNQINLDLASFVQRRQSLQHSVMAK